MQNMIMTDQQQIMPPQSPLVHQQSYGQQQQGSWGINQQHQQYNPQQVQFNQQRIPQSNSLSNPPTPHQQMPPPNMVQQSQIQPPSQSPQLGQINQSGSAMMQRNPIQHGGNSMFPQMNQQFVNQQHQQFPMGNQIPQQHHQNQAQFQQPTPHQQHPNMMQQPPPPMPPPQVINLPLHLQPEYRIYEMNKRLSNRPDQLLLPVSHQNFDPNICYMWYDSFVNEFFDENAKLTIRNVIEENGSSKSYTLSRSLIPRFFRSFSDGGCMDLNFQIQRGQIINIQPITSPNNGSHQQQIILYESDSCIINCKLGKPMYAKICIEGNLFLECVLDIQQPPGSNHIIFESIKIKHFTFFIKRHQELIPRSTICILQETNPNVYDQLSTNITRTGLTQQTIKYLKICSVLEPMQELMMKNKQTGLSPRECLRSCASQRVNNSRNIHHPQASQQQMPTTPTTPQLNSPFQRNPSMIQNEDLVNKTPDGNSKQNSNQSTPNDNSRTPTKRRKRKSSPTNQSPNEIKKEPGPASKSKKGAAAAANAAVQQHQPSPPVFNYNQIPGGYIPPMPGGDVMVVGEPSLMGGDFGEEDERLITRLENNQFENMNSNLMSQQIPNHLKQPQFIQQQQQMNLQRINSFNPSNQIHPPPPQQSSQQILEDSKQQISMMLPSPMGSIQPPPRPPSSLPVSMPPRPQSTSHFINSNPNSSIVDQQQARSLTPSPSTSNLITGLGPKTPTPHPSPSLTPQNTQMIDLNLNGNSITPSNASSASSSSSKSPSLTNSNLINGVVTSQLSQQPSTSTSSSAIASSSTSLSPNCIFNSSTNNGATNNSSTSILSPGQSGIGNNKQNQLNNDQTQQNQQQTQKSIFLSNF